MIYRMVFRAAPMDDVAARLEREFGIEVDIPAYLVGRRLDASFEGQSIAEIAPLIAAHGERSRRARIRIRRRKESARYKSSGIGARRGTAEPCRRRILEARGGGRV